MARACIRQDRQAAGPAPRPTVGPAPDSPWHRSAPVRPEGECFTTVDAYAEANPHDFGEILAASHETGSERRGLGCEGRRGGRVFRIAGTAAAVVQGARAVYGVVRWTFNLVRGVRGPLHHIMTNKNRLSTARGGPWTPRFEEIAQRSGMTLEDAANQIRVPGHSGPHPEAYHRAVFQRLQGATRGLEGDAYSGAFRAELNAIRGEIATAGSALHRLLTGH